MKTITHLTLLTLLAVSFATTASALTEKQIKGKKNYFLKFDADKNQALSEKEFVEMTRTQFLKTKKEGHEAEGAKRFKRNDKDSDGKVTFDEWFSNQKK